MGHNQQEAGPPGDPAPELLEGRLWVDGCFDFFHHGLRPRFPKLLSRARLGSQESMLNPALRACWRHCSGPAARRRALRRRSFRRGHS